MSTDSKTETIIPAATGQHWGLTITMHETRYGDNLEYRMSYLKIEQDIEGMEHRSIALNLSDLEAIVKAARAAERKATQA